MMAAINRFAPFAAAALLPALLAGCISLAPKPPAQLISLTPTATAPAGDLAANSSGAPLVVLDPETDRMLDVLRVPVQVSPSAIAYVKKAVWIEKPARQFRSLLAETIRAKNNRLVFEGIDAEQGDRPLLTGRLTAMGYDAASGSVVVRYDAQLVVPGTPLKMRRFEATVPGVSPDAEALAPALNRAANDVATQVAAWLT
jgi:cholesterol transport system auxiliary component